MTKPTLLLVDDEPDLRDALSEYFSASGFVVTAVHSAAEALAWAKDEEPRAVLADLNLPDARGEIFLLEARRHFPHAQLYVHSGDVEFRPSLTLIAAGVTKEHVFTKPSKLSLLVKQIQSDLAVF